MLAETANQPLDRHLAAVEVAGDRFFAANARRLAAACWGMARRFHAGGQLLVLGDLTDASHNAVEFVHPVLVGKRALPALALADAHLLEVLARPGDLVMRVTPGRLDLDGEIFEVSGEDRLAAQEVIETAYHELWELVHVFFEHEGMLAQGPDPDGCVTCGDVALPACVINSNGLVRTGQGDQDADLALVGPVHPGDLVLVHGGVAVERLQEIDAFAREFYPFLGTETADVQSILADVTASVEAKWREVTELRRALDRDAVASAASAVAARVAAGGRVLAFGNGGSATDSADLAADLLRAGMPALDLAGDPAILTALGNDLGFEEIFARQVIALGRPGDVAVGITASGRSGNLVRGLERARAAGLLTIVLAGNGGGGMVGHPAIDHLLTVGSAYVPRVQEVQATIYHAIVRHLETAQ